MPFRSLRGSALLSALIFGVILLLALSALAGTAISEYRGATRAAMNTAAFCLAEAGVDRAAACAFDDSFATSADWTASGSDTYTRTFTADSASLGSLTGHYKVVVKTTVVSPGTTTFAIYSRGHVANSGAALTAERAVKVTFTRTTTGSTGNAKGCLAYGTFDGASTGTSGIDPNQIGSTYDSYISTGNTAPNYLSNRGSNCLVGTNSAEDNKLQLGNGEYYCRIGTGGSDQVGYNVSSHSATTVLAKSLNLNNASTSDDTTLLPYVPAMLKRDVVIPPPNMVPLRPDSGWTVVRAGKVSDYHDTSLGNVSATGSTLTLGATNNDKVYFATTDLGTLEKIDVRGTAVLIVSGQAINTQNKLTINFLTADASLKIYTDSQISGIINSTQQLSQAAAVQNWEPARLSVYVEPAPSAATNWAGIYSAGDTPEAIVSKVETAVAGARYGSGGATLNMNFSAACRFVGSIIAPYSLVDLSATGTDRKFGGTGTMSDFCGALIAGSISIKGSNGFAFHFDEKLGGASGSNPSLTLSQWQQILPSNSIFN